MADLIERSAAIDAICELHFYGKNAVFGVYNENSYAEHLHDAVKAVEKVEAVDAVPVAWLKEKLTGHPELSYAVTDAIRNVLDLWEEEHGTD